jgi:hypothetical protein
MARRFGLEPAIMKKLEHVAELEVKYTEAVAFEVAQGYNKRKPFLRSRMLLREIKNTLRDAQDLELQHNYNPIYQPTNLIAETVFNNTEMFEQSAKIISNKYNLHPQRPKKFIQAPEKDKSLKQLAAEFFKEPTENFEARIKIMQKIEDKEEQVQSRLKPIYSDAGAAELEALLKLQREQEQEDE